MTFPGADGPGIIDSLQHGDPLGTVWRPAEVDVSIRPGWFHHASEDARVRSVDDLMNLYFTSVGRNGKLLLNVPPTRDGLLHPTDVARLREFRERRDARFGEDVVRARRHEWRVTGDRTARLELDLAEPATVSVARLSENIARGQRIARYTLEGAEREDDAWRNISSGTTIGYAKLDRFPSMRLRRIRLTIEDAVSTPDAVTIKLFALRRLATRRARLVGGEPRLQQTETGRTDTNGRTNNAVSLFPKSFLLCCAAFAVRPFVPVRSVWSVLTVEVGRGATTCHGSGPHRTGEMTSPLRTAVAAPLTPPRVSTAFIAIASASVDPRAEGGRDLVADGFQQSRQPERGVRQSDAGPLGVARVEELLEMILDRNHEHLLAEVRGLAHGFEAGRARHAARRGHQAKELLAVDLVEGQMRIDALFVRGAGLVVETVHRHLRVVLVPADDVVGVTGVQQVHEKVSVERVRALLEELAAQDRRTDEQTTPRKIRRLVEGQRQSRRTRAGQRDVRAHSQAVERPFAVLHERRMVEHELVADGQHGHAVPPHGVVDADQRFEKIDDQIGLDRRDRLVNRARLRRNVGAFAKAFVAVRKREMPRPLATAKPGLAIDWTRPANASSKNVGRLRFWFDPTRTAAT